MPWQIAISAYKRKKEKDFPSKKYFYSQNEKVLETFIA